MDKFDNYPKSIKKAIRYLKQEAPLEQLSEIRQLVDRAVQMRTVKTKPNS